VAELAEILKWVNHIINYLKIELKKLLYILIAYCRLYYSKEDRDLLTFLIKQEVEDQKNKKKVNIQFKII
jgi:hypothetical protein